MTAAAGWVCPTCGRTFANAHQWHSCSVSSIAAHLSKTSPEIAGVYRLLEKRIEALGNVTVEPMKTAIVFKSVVSFAGVRVRRAWLNLGLLMEDRLASPRFDRVVTLSPSTHEHRLKIRSEEDLDPELAGWLRKAHRLGCRAGR